MTVDEGIRDLCARGFVFHAIRDEDGEVRVLVGAYGWPSWPPYYDRLHIWDEHEAIAARAVPSGRHGAEDVVWTYSDDALATIQALLELPGPDEPGAPRLARRAPSDLWLPPSGMRV
jgi:hypothetical protein